MKKYFKFLGIAFVATAFCVAFASCGDKDDDNDNNASGGGGITQDDYVDLGLPSGTKWKAENETNPNDEYGFYTYDEAMGTFGDKIPTKEQFEELKARCQWTWNGGGYKVKGRNGNSIDLPAEGYRNCDWEVGFVGSRGNYTTSTLDGSKRWYLYFTSDSSSFISRSKCHALSVRLVQN